MDLDLTGLNVLITGGSIGIGFAIAKDFVKEGADVTIVSRSQENLKNFKVKTIAADLSKSESIATFSSSLASRAHACSTIITGHRPVRVIQKSIHLK